MPKKQRIGPRKQLPFHVVPNYQGSWVRRKQYEAAIRAGLAPCLRADLEPANPAPHYTQEDICDCCGSSLRVNFLGYLYQMTCSCDHPYLICNDCFHCSQHHDDADHPLTNATSSSPIPVTRIGDTNA